MPVIYAANIVHMQIFMKDTMKNTMNEKTDLTSYLQENTPTTFCCPVDWEPAYNQANEIIKNKRANFFEIIPVFNGNIQGCNSLRT